MIKLKLKVNKIEPPGEDDGKDYPVVSFDGTSWSLQERYDSNANSLIRGLWVLKKKHTSILISFLGEVRQTPQGEIRWTTYSIYHG